MGRVMEGWRRLRSLVRRDELESGLDEEIRFHIDRQAEKYIQSGMTPDEARRRAALRFGNVDRARESTRDEYRAALVEDVARDVRHGARALLRAPGFTIVAILTLSLGIGATTAMFSVVNGVLLRPLPYPHQDRLVELVHEAPGLGRARILASPAVYFGYRDHSRAFEAVGLWDWDSSPVTVTGGGEPEAVHSVEVTHEVLGLLGASPLLGRGFGPVDDAPGSTPTAIVSHAYRQRRFGGEDAIGRTLVVDGVAREIIGVLPASFRFFDYAADIFYPMQLVRSEAGFPQGDGRGLARLRPGVTLEQANADVRRMIPLINAEFGRPGPGFDRLRFGPNLQPLKSMVVGGLGDTLWLLMGTIALLLLIACANVANLVLVRTQSRRRELSVRTALGARWTDIARVVLAENAILGLAGGAAGVAVAHVSLPYLLALGRDDLPYIMTVRIDLTVLLATLAASAFATIVFASVPILRFARPRRQLAEALHGARGQSEGREGNRARHALLVAQVALALVLLVGCGLMIRTFVSLRQVDPGFGDASSVQTFQVTLPAAVANDGPPPGAFIRIQHAIADRLATVPGVSSAGFTSANDGLPLDGDGRSAGITVEGRTDDDAERGPKEIQFAAPGFFETMRTPLLAGRAFEWNDVDQERPVAIVSENFARSQFGAAGDAIGRRLRVGGPANPWLDIVGVVKDVRHNGLDAPPPETVVLPPSARRTATFVVRSERAGTAALLEELRRAVWAVNGDLSLANVRTLGDLYDRSMARTSMTLELLAISGALALVLGVVGVYGVVCYAIGQRRREIGIRMALGAQQGQVRRMFVGGALALVAAGVVIGLAAAAVLTRLMASQLFGVSPLDPATHLAVAALLVLAAGLASYLSARRASAVDPVGVLREV